MFEVFDLVLAKSKDIDLPLAMESFVFRNEIEVKLVILKELKLTNIFMPP